MFPLGSVLTPQMLLPLHIFEPRYRRMVGDCLEFDRGFGVVLIERGSEVGGGEQRSDVGTLAAITEAVPLEDGRWAVVAVGTTRIRVVEWLDDDPYPRARVEAWPDGDPSGDLPAAVAAATGRLRRFLTLATELGASGLPLDLEFSPDPAEAADQLVAVSPVGALDRHTLLVAPEPVERLERLVAFLDDELGVLEARLAMGDGPDDPREHPGGAN